MDPASECGQLGGSPIAEMTGSIYCDSAVGDNVG
jgi:hypothetical protein